MSALPHPSPLPPAEPERRTRRRRRPRAEPRARHSRFSRYTVAAGLRNTLAASWAADTFGPLTTPWLPSTGMTPEVRFAYVIALADAYLKQISDGAWGVRLDLPSRPSVLILDGAGEPELLPCHYRGRSLYLAGVTFVLVSEGVAERIVDHLAFKLAAHFGT